MVSVLSHIAEAAAAGDIGIEGGHRGSPFCQTLHGQPDFRRVGGTQGNGLRPCLRRLVQQAAALPVVPPGVGAQIQRHVVVPVLLQKAGGSRLHLLLHIALFPLRLYQRQMPGGAAGGQCAGHAVGTVVQFLQHPEHPLPHLRLYIGSVMEHPIHRSDGYPGPLRNHFDGGSHPSLPLCPLSAFMQPPAGAPAASGGNRRVFCLRQARSMTIYKILCIQMRGSVLYYIKFSVREQASPAFSPYFFLSFVFYRDVSAVE